MSLAVGGAPAAAKDRVETPFRRFVSDDLMAFDLIEVPQEIGTETITEHPIGQQGVQGASQ